MTTNLHFGVSETKIGHGRSKPEMKPMATLIDDNPTFLVGLVKRTKAGEATAKLRNSARLQTVGKILMNDELSQLVERTK